MNGLHFRRRHRPRSSALLSILDNRRISVPLPSKCLSSESVSPLRAVVRLCVSVGFSSCAAAVSSGVAAVASVARSSFGVSGEFVRRCGAGDPVCAGQREQRVLVCGPAHNIDASNVPLGCSLVLKLLDLLWKHSTLLLESQ